MAAAVDTANATPAKKGPGLIVQLAVLLALTVAAAGIGWLTGQILTDDEASGSASAQPAAASGEHGAAKGKEGEANSPLSLHLLPLETITTNLADPTEIWVRLEVALVFKDEVDAQLGEIVHQDLLAYLRTVKARQIQGSSGFQHLRSDLDERAQIRSEGKIKQVLVRTLLFE